MVGASGSVSTPAALHVSVTLDKLAKLLKADHGLAAYCPSCRRWADLDLARLVSEGHGRQRLHGFKPRCRACGRREGNAQRVC